jgi:hypothetical protein
VDHLSTGQLWDVDKIIKNFDFEYVRKYMFETDWKWAVPKKGQSYKDMEFEIPSIDRMKKTALSLILDAKFQSRLDRDEACISTGGFYAYRDDDETLSLSFRKMLDQPDDMTDEEWEESEESQDEILYEMINTFGKGLREYYDG